MSEQIIKDFIKLWFRQFDILDKKENFIKYLSPKVVMNFPEGEFIGHEGFSKWYEGVKDFIKPNNTHTITDIVISPNKNGTYKVNFKSKVKGESPKGKEVNLKVSEEWEVKLQDEEIEILTYQVLV